MEYVSEPIDETDAESRKYAHKINKDEVKALQRSIDKASGDWIESFSKQQNSVIKLEKRSNKLDTTQGIII